MHRKNVEQILQNASFENFLEQKTTEVFKGEMNYFSHVKQLSRRMGKNMLYPDRKYFASLILKIASKILSTRGFCEAIDYILSCV